MPTANTSTHRYAWIAKLSAAIFLNLLLAEVLTRSLITSPSVQEFDPILGWHYLSNSRILHSKEGFAVNYLNELGLNHPSIGPKDKSRVLVLGDSYVESVQVPQKENFISHLNTAFADIEFINAGRSDIGPAEMPIIYLRLGHLAPDSTLIVMNESDIWDAQLGHITLLIENGKAVDVHTSPPAKDRFKQLVEPMVQNSAFFTLMMRRAKPIVSPYLSYISNLLTAENQNNSHTDLPPAPAGTNYERAEDVIRLSLVKLLQHTPITLAYIPEFSYLQYGVAMENEHSIIKKKILEKLCRELKIPFIDTSPELRLAYQKSLQPPVGFFNSQPGTGHLNSMGHQAVGQSIIKAYLE